MLKDHGGVESSKDLGESGFDRVVDGRKIVGILDQAQLETGAAARRGDLPTPAQLDVIQHLWTDLAEFIEPALSRKFRAVL